MHINKNLLQENYDSLDVPKRIINETWVDLTKIFLLIQTFLRQTLIFFIF